MPLIRTNAGIVTQINTFTVTGGDPQKLIDSLREGAQFASATPGWLSASLHRSHDGTRVVNYAQSDSLDAALAVIDRLRREGFLERNAEHGEAHPGLYDVVYTLER
ncbi:antibiotic biosynthesis monooxygenase [Mycobacterium sp.]|uniref:antibiotic biosynthesis monooxygenase family protein n=1 Tax=Mycobacterium sp. TaxID=1785 RepID=UPI0026007046|nr:antibiotic biosynthesis monooxygenase [Mycobacterium sp.]